MSAKPQCIKCGANLSQGAQFCHACGANQTVSGASTIPLPWLFGGFFVVLVAVAALSYNLGKSAAAPSAGTPPGMMGTGSGLAPDISSMTPRQQADRLYDMVMTAHEQGDQARMAQFAPMALQAYTALGALDADAHFHVGLISVFTGNIEEGLARADSIEQGAPQHLFGSILRFNAAMLQGDPGTAQAAQRVFLANYDPEIALNRDEYQIHQRQLDGFLARARDEVGGGS